MTIEDEALQGTAGVAAKLENDDVLVPNNLATWATQLSAAAGTTFFLYVVHLRIPDAVKMDPRATHEIGAFFLRNRKRHMLLTLQFSLEDDGVATRLLETLVAGLINGHLPMSRMVTTEEMNVWMNCASQVLRAWDNPLLH